jgi:thiol-disulfide isomerase/thioredoxin
MTPNRSPAIARRKLLALASASALPTVVTASAAATIQWPEQTRLLDGSLQSPKDWQGKPLLLIFWATYCPFCQRHNANLQQLLNEWPEAPRVLGVAQDKEAAKVQQYMSRHGYRFDVTLDYATWQAAASVRKAIPTTVPIDRQGRIGQVVPGEMFPEDLLQLARWAKGAAAG